MFRRISITVLLIGLLILLLAGAFLAGQQSAASPLSPVLDSFFSKKNTKPDQPLLQYAIPALRAVPRNPSEPLTLIQDQTDSGRNRWLFSLETLDQTMSGQLTLPTTEVVETSESLPVIVMVRGYIPPEGYQSGDGTRNAAAAYADAGFATLALDFFGFGESDPAPDDVWEGRFIKPLSVLDLIDSLRTHGVPVAEDQLLPVRAIGLWGHSNGGQIALTTLQALEEPMPTTLWAAVTAPFPYSVLFFSDEDLDEGKAARAWIAQFEALYDAHQFSLTQHLDLLAPGPILLHHGTDDQAAIIGWADDFAQKIAAENNRRAALAEPIDPIELTYYRYPGADHNLRPVWSTVVERDITFFTETLQ